MLVLGTSLTAGYGLPLEQAYPAVLQRTVDVAGLPFRIVNAGVSGETSAGARRRLPWLLRQRVDVLVVETGANDMLRGLEPDSLRANLEAIVTTARRLRPGLPIVLLGLPALPNLGAAYGRRFAAAYRAVAERHDLPFHPFFLAGVAGVDSLNLPDGLHPNAAGQRRVAATVWTVLEPVLRRYAAHARCRANQATSPSTSASEGRHPSPPSPS